MRQRTTRRAVLQIATVGALMVTTLVAFGLARSTGQADLHRQRVQAADQLSLEIEARISAALAAEEGVYNLGNGLPSFTGGQFLRFGRDLIREHGLSYVGWAPAVDVERRRAFERQHALKIEGSQAHSGVLVPVLYAAADARPAATGIRPGLNLLSLPRVGPTLAESAEAQDPGVSGNARVDGAPGVVLLQPMFGRDETGERIVGWVVAGIRADRLIREAQAGLQSGAAARVTVDGRPIYGPSRAPDPEDVISMSVGTSTWRVAVTGVGSGFALALPWIALVVGIGLTGLVAFLFRQAARLDRVRRAELSRLAQAALVDSLTGLKNHRAFQEDLAGELKRLSRTDGPLGLVMVDFDGLKEVNDVHGHHEGDERLKRLAGFLRDVSGGCDLLYRLGGDEFAVVLPATNAWGSLQYVQRLQAALEAPSEHPRIAVAAGIADTVGLDDGKDSLIRRAAVALAEAKRSGRGALVYSQEFEPVAQQADHEREEEHTRTLATALARAVDAKDAYTRSHCETVSQICAMIAEELGFDERRIAKLRLAGLLHDVGKIGIADAILNKPERLTDEEFEIMKAHATLGHSIVSAAERDEEAFWILHHHERVDGRGYPAGLQGEEIPIESRIILVADAFEAITADRPYRKRASVDEALAELDRHSGTQFDPRCVAALQRAIGRGSGVLDATPGTDALTSVS